MKVTVAILALAIVFAGALAARQPSGPVKNFVVLMMENRAYDHLLGYFKIPGAQLDGLTGKEFNRWTAGNSNSRAVYVSMDAEDVRMLYDPIDNVIYDFCGRKRGGQRQHVVRILPPTV